MSLELANQIAAASVAACAANGYSVTVTVVDRAGGVRAVQRADNAGPHTLGASQQKAFTSASAKNTTLAMMEDHAEEPGAPRTWATSPASCCSAAACRSRSATRSSARVGVGGAPGGHLDEQCAMAALDKVKDLLK